MRERRLLEAPLGPGRVRRTPPREAGPTSSSATNTETPEGPRVSSTYARLSRRAGFGAAPQCPARRAARPAAAWCRFVRAHLQPEILPPFGFLVFSHSVATT